MKILVLVDYYVPGHRAGGPIRTIVNMVESLGDEIDFFILTRDRDFGANQPYDDVQINKWNRIGKANIFYASPDMFSWRGFRRILATTSCDILYLNSFFSPRASCLMLLLRRFGLINIKRIVIAPRGEFSPGALQLKPKKKIIYITITKKLGLYDNLVWQASSENEEQDIRKIMGSVSKYVIVAPNLLPAAPFRAESNVIRRGYEKNNGRLRLVFLSRISAKKNLDFLLYIISKAKSPIDVSIYGPLEDAGYWRVCENLICELPANVSARYYGNVRPEDVPNIFSKHDVFFFPTRGENFGHVIFESLAVGTCVVLSDQTPWKQDSNGAVQIIPLGSADAWVAALDDWATRTDEQISASRDVATAYARDYIAMSPAVEKNCALFRFAYKQRSISD